MGTDLVIDPFPFVKSNVELIQLSAIRYDGIEFFQVSAMSPFDPAIKFGGGGAILAGYLPQPVLARPRTLGVL